MASNKQKRTELINKVGNYCWFCRMEFPYNKLEYHHCIPRYLKSNLDGDFGIVSCRKCHVKIHRFDFGSPEYMYMTLEAMEFFRLKTKKKI